MLSRVYNCNKLQQEKHSSADNWIVNISGKDTAVDNEVIVVSKALNFKVVFIFKDFEPFR